jgi:hypothetical protein
MQKLVQHRTIRDTQVNGERRLDKWINGSEKLLVRNVKASPSHQVKPKSILGFGNFVKRKSNQTLQIGYVFLKVTNMMYFLYKNEYRLLKLVEITIRRELK